VTCRLLFFLHPHFFLKTSNENNWHASLRAISDENILNVSVLTNRNECVRVHAHEREREREKRIEDLDL
jgi:hypothetical protein